MSNMDASSKAAETQIQQQKGPEAYLSSQEREMVVRLLRFDEEFPKEFKSWITDYLSVNFPEIPITQISGFEKYLYKSGQELPANPRDGQRYTFIVDPATGIAWTFQYNASSQSQYKWEFAGGASVGVTADGEVSTTASSYKDLGGPGATVPLAGDYLVTWGSIYYNTTDGGDTLMGIGSSTANIYQQITAESPGGRRTAMAKSVIVNVASPGDAIKAFYRVATSDGRTGAWRERWIIIQPQRVI
jgi:hypothetical protein